MGGREVSERLGDALLDPKLQQAMEDVAALLDRVLNGNSSSDDRETGFILTVLHFSDGPTSLCNSVSNMDRTDVVAVLKHQIARYGEYPDQNGRADA